LAKVFIDNSIQQSQRGNINKTITHLRSAEQELISSGTGNHYFPFQSLSTLLLVKDVIQSLENGDINKAAVYLNLADQQLGRALLNIPLLPNATNKTAATIVAHISNGTFLTYTNSKSGINYIISMIGLWKAMITLQELEEFKLLHSICQM
jgi:hypothetical protein